MEHVQGVENKATRMVMYPDDGLVDGEARMAEIYSVHRNTVRNSKGKIPMSIMSRRCKYICCDVVLY